MLAYSFLAGKDTATAGEGTTRADQDIYCCLII